MCRLNRYVRPLKASFEQCPEVFQPVCVNQTVNVPLHMVNEFINEIRVKSAIGREGVSEDVRARLDVLMDDVVERFPLRVRDDRRADLALALFCVTFKQIHYGSLASAAGASDGLAPSGRVHVLGQTADECFV